MVLFLFSFVSAKLRNALPDLVSVPMSLLVLKENPGPHFVQRLFFLMNISFKYYVFSVYLYMLCILACKCIVSKTLAPVVILKFEMK